MMDGVMVLRLCKEKVQMSEGSKDKGSIDPMELWKQWSDTSVKMWTSVLDGDKEKTFMDPYGMYRPWLKTVEEAQEQLKSNPLRLMDPNVALKEWFGAITAAWAKAAGAGGDPLGLTTQWLEMMEEARAKLFQGGTIPADPFTFFKQWYDASSETWSEIVGEMIGAEKFVEIASQFMDSYTSFYQIARRQNEEYFRNLQLPTRSDIARVAGLVVEMEEKVDRIEDAFEDFEDGYSKVATLEAVESLDGRLESVEKKLDALPSSLEKMKAEAVGGLESRLSSVESKLEAFPAALEKIEAVEALSRRIGQVESKLDQVLDALVKFTTNNALDTQKAAEASGQTNTTATIVPRKTAKKNAKRPEVSSSESE